MTTKEILRDNLSELCDILVFQTLEGEIELGIMNVKEQNERYKNTIDEILECDAKCVSLLLHVLDENLKMIPLTYYSHKDLDRMFVDTYTLAEVKDINDELNGGEDYE